MAKYMAVGMCFGVLIGKGVEIVFAMLGHIEFGIFGTSIGLMLGMVIGLAVYKSRN